MRELALPSCMLLPGRYARHHVIVLALLRARTQVVTTLLQLGLLLGSLGWLSQERLRIVRRVLLHT